MTIVSSTTVLRGMLFTLTILGALALSACKTTDESAPPAAKDASMSTEQPATAPATDATTPTPTEKTTDTP
jgi:hypothetical protein